MKIQVKIDIDEIRAKKIGWMLGYHPEENFVASADCQVECEDWLNSFIEESIDSIDLPDF